MESSSLNTLTVARANSIDVEITSVNRMAPSCIMTVPHPADSTTLAQKPELVERQVFFGRAQQESRSRPGSGGKEKWRILPVGRSARPAGRPGRRPPEEHAMAKGIKPVGANELEPVSLSELIHQHVRAAIEVAVHEELRAALGTRPHERSEGRRGYRNGIRERTLTG